MSPRSTRRGGQPRRSGSPRILFATSNGTGLGHLNRAMAIARRLPAGWESKFFTLSAAAPVVASEGWGVDYLASYRRPGSGTDRSWDLRLRDLLGLLLEERDPDLVVFDGVHPYRGLTHVLSSRGAPPSIWCRRAMWRPDTPAKAPLARVGAFDAVLEPGELAAAVDGGPTVGRRGEAKHVGPIVFLDRDELLPRKRAAAELGLDPSRRTALVNLGQGGEVDRAVAGSLRALTGVPGLQVAALRSSIGPGLTVPEGVVALDSTFPMSRYFRAFDLAVAAAGYNAFHELLAFAVPTLFVPMPRRTDDQAARARWAAGEGLALAVDGPIDGRLEPRLRRLADPGISDRLRLACEAASFANGAVAAAALVEAMLAGRRPAPEVRDRGRVNRWLRLSSHPVGPSLPLVAAIGVRDLARHPERRSPRLAVLALGVPAGELEERISAAIRGTDPQRILVLTDSLDFRLLRRLGVGFELLPAVASRGVVDGATAAEVRRRVQALLARRRPIRAISIGAWGGEILDSTAISTEDRSR